MGKKISIIIPCRNEERYIEDCLNSILTSDFNDYSFEILVVDGESDDNTKEILKKYADKNSNVKVLENKKKIAPVAMNLGIKQSTGEFIFIISAHAKYEKDYFKKLVEYAGKLGADCVGGVLCTDVKAQNNASIAVKNVLSDKLGVGSSFRTGADKICEVDTVPFGCYKRDVFCKVGMYNEKLVRNQDIELNKRIVNSGGKIYIVPHVKCTYFARETFDELAKNSFENGKWNILTAYYTKNLKSLSFRHYVPLIFILSIIFPLFVSFLYPVAGLVSAGILLVYLTVIFFRSVVICGNTTFYHQIFAFVVLHFSYAMGEVAGFFKLISENFYKKAGKRIFDLLLSVSGIVLLLPFFVVIPVLIKLDDKGKIFYKQKRVGRKGKIFNLIKFRTMVENADKIGGTVTKENDERITKIGRFLRKTKLDEIPQLFNILKGDMSFVGPRPDVPGYADELTGDDAVILEVLPGITGPATIKYRNEEEILSKVENPEKYNDEVLWPDKVKINKEYVKNLNFMDDLKYILKTLKIIKD